MWITLFTSATTQHLQNYHLHMLMTTSCQSPHKFCFRIYLFACSFVISKLYLRRCTCLAAMELTSPAAAHTDLCLHWYHTNALLVLKSVGTASKLSLNPPKSAGGQEVERGHRWGEHPSGQFQADLLILFPLGSLGPSLQMVFAQYNTACEATRNIHV